MPARFQAETFTPAVLDAQRRYYGRSAQREPTDAPDRLGPGEIEFLAERDSFSMATVSPDGWPYVQHRGGPRGFLQVLDAQTLAFGAEGPIHEPLSVGRVGWETVVVDSGRDFAETGPVRLDHRDLGALRAISEVLAQSEENRVTLGGPIGRLRKLSFLLEQGLRHVPPRLDLDQRGV